MEPFLTEFFVKAEVVAAAHAAFETHSCDAPMGCTNNLKRVVDVFSHQSCYRIIVEVIFVQLCSKMKLTVDQYPHMRWCIGS